MSSEPSYAGKYLRATATYDDGEGEGKTAQMVSANPVRAKDYRNEAPVFKNVYDEEITGNIDRKVAEDTVAGGNVGEPVTATDDARDVLTYTLLDNETIDSDSNAGTPANMDGDSIKFTIDSGTGQIKVGTGVTLNAEATPKYTVTVTATDPPGLSAEITVDIAVTDVDEAPTIVAPTATAGHTSKRLPREHGGYTEHSDGIHPIQRPTLRTITVLP